MRGLPTDGHEILPRTDTAYSITGRNDGRPADLSNPAHYPAEAICVCGEMVRIEAMFLGDWHHTGRKPGDPR